MDSKYFLMGIIFLYVFCVSLSSAAAKITIPIFLVNSNQISVGTITAENSVCGVLLTPHLHDLTPGIHGFHIHQNPSCKDKGMAAGDHLDPANTTEHRGPYHQGHLGDLPVLIVNADGTASLPALAPRFTLKKLKGRTIMIHAGADNYSDTPQKNGGGGERYACGVIE